MSLSPTSSVFEYLGSKICVRKSTFEYPCLKTDHVQPGRFCYTDRGVTHSCSDPNEIGMAAFDLSQMSDGAIVAQVLAGESQQFDLLVKRYQATLVRVAFSRFGRVDWAEDAVQETFLRAFQSLATYNSQYSFRTWLWTILLNECRRQAKRGSRTRAVFTGETAEAELAKIESAFKGPVQTLVSKERSLQLEAWLSSLPEVQADALRLRFYGNLKYHEIAAAMGSSLAGAKKRVRSGLETLALRMKSAENIRQSIDKSSRSTQSSDGRGSSS